MGLRLFFLPNFPGATFIQRATFIPDSRVDFFLINVVLGTYGISPEVSAISGFGFGIGARPKKLFLVVHYI